MPQSMREEEDNEQEKQQHWKLACHLWLWLWLPLYNGMALVWHWAKSPEPQEAGLIRLATGARTSTTYHTPPCLATNPTSWKLVVGRRKPIKTKRG